MNREHITPCDSWSYISQAQLGWLGISVLTQLHHLSHRHPVPTSQGHPTLQSMERHFFTVYLPHKALGLL